MILKTSHLSMLPRKYCCNGLKNDAKSFLRKIKRKNEKLVVKGEERNTNTI